MSKKKARTSVVTAPETAIADAVRSRLFWQAGCEAHPGAYVLPSLHGYEEERRRLVTALGRTTEHGESNSLLVIGPRGCGKTLLIETALRDAGLVPAPACATESPARVVRLNGLLQTDEHLALEELARQLRLENVTDGGEYVLGSFAEQQQFLLDALRSGDRQGSKPVIVILDEFDLFATHRNQSLLYNLFDIAQSRQTPLFVIGVTCRLDVFELLEKRVKSRYSHRAVYMFEGRPFEEYEKLFCYYLRVMEDSGCAPTLASKWNQSVQRLMGDAHVRRALQQCHRVASRDVRSLQRVVFLTLCNATARGAVEVIDALEAVKATIADSTAAMLRGVSVLELALLVAMRQLAELYDGEPFNFSMVYERYRAFCERSTSGKACEKVVALKAFEHLAELELVQPAASAGDGTPKEYRLVRLLVDGSQLAEALQTYTGCPTEIKQWANSSIATA